MKLMSSGGVQESLHNRPGPLTKIQVTDRAF